MSEIEKNLTDPELMDSAIQIYKEFVWGVSADKPVLDEETKRQARLYAIAELTRWQQDPVTEEALIAEIYPTQDPKLYFEAIKYLLKPKNFEAIHNTVLKLWHQEKSGETVSSSRQRVQTSVNDALN